MGDATGASAASAAPGSTLRRSGTIRVTASTEKLLSLFTLMNQIDFTINTCEKKTADDAKLGQAWAIKKLRETPVISTLRRLLLAFKFILVIHPREPATSMGRSARRESRERGVSKHPQAGIGRALVLACSVRRRSRLFVFVFGW